MQFIAQIADILGCNLGNELHLSLGRLMAGIGAPATMKPQSRRQPGSPVVDEAAFQQLLSAAYVMQEHNSRLKKVPQPTKQNMMAASATAPAKATVIEPIPIPEQKQATPTCQECGSELAR